MATRAPIECPLCRIELTPNQNLREHLVGAHTKQQLARFVVAETEALYENDISD